MIQFGSFTSLSFLWTAADWWFSPDILVSSTNKTDLSDILCRITAILKVETDIIISIVAHPIGLAAILVILYVKTLKTDIYCFCLWCRNVFHVTLTEIFSISHLWRSQYHSVGWYNVLTISLCEIKGKMSELQIKLKYCCH